MKAVVYQEPFEVTVEQMLHPKIEAPTDAAGESPGGAPFWT